MAKDAVSKTFTRDTATGPWSSKPNIPYISVAPVVSGTTEVGSTLSCTTGTWTNSPTSYAYQWLRDGSDITGADDGTYELVGDDEGADISCEVTASNAEGASTPAVSNEVGPIGASAGFDFYIGPSGSDSNDGLTPSTPWAITAINTKRADYTGMSVGLLDGTYDLTGYSYGDSDRPKLEVQAGTSGSPTIIQAVNARQAILTNKSGDTHGRQPCIGQYTGTAGLNRGYVTIKDLVVTGCQVAGIYFQWTGTDAEEILVEGCEIYDNEWPSSNSNSTGVWFTGCLGATVRNCLIHDMVSLPSNGHNSCGVQWYDCRGTVCEYNEVYNVTAAFYDKNQINSGSIVRYNYVHDVASLCFGFNTESAGSPAGYADHEIYNNVAVCDASSPFPFNNGFFATQAGVQFYNNTLRVVGNGDTEGLVKITNGVTDSIEFYNNILSWTGSVGYLGAVSFAATAVDVCDRNCYQQGSESFNASLMDFDDGGNIDTSYGSFAAWQGAGFDANSIVDDPEFVATGSGAAYYKLGGSSPCLGAGVGGVNIGAYSSAGQTEQIGPNW